MQSKNAIAARPHPSTPTAAGPAAAEPVTAEALGWQLRAALPPMRLHSVSIYDDQANVLWLSEGVLGPDEHNLVVEAVSVLSAQTSQACHENGLEDGRLAMFLPVRAPLGDLVGLAMILADLKSTGDGLHERLMSPQVRTVLQRIAVLLRPLARKVQPTQQLGHSASTLDSVARRSNMLPTASLELDAAVAASASPEPLSPHVMDDILEFELAPEPLPRDSKRVLPTDLPVLSSASQPAEPADLNFELVPDPPDLAARVPTLTVPKPANAGPVSAASGSSRTPQWEAGKLILELQRFAKLRAGGRTRRFEVRARNPAREIMRNPGMLDSVAVQHLLAWLGENRGLWCLEPTSFTLGVSIATLESDRFPQHVAACLKANGVSPETLGFGITEALCTQHRAQVERFMGACERLGCFVVIEDFSFDSAVLPLLRSRALRLVKIDPKLTSMAMKDKLSQAIVVAIVHAAKVLGIHCAASRVESQAAARWLAGVGCDFAQGAALTPPMPLESLTVEGS